MIRGFRGAAKRALAEARTRPGGLRMPEAKASLLQAAILAKVVPWTLDLESGQWVFEASIATVLGYSPREFRADPTLLESLIHPEDVHRFISARAGCDAGKPVGFDCRLAHRSGAWLWTRWTLAFTPGRMHGVLQDVSELHATQEQLIQSQKAETASILVSGLCHDFNNVIAVIAGGAAYLLLQGLPDEQQETAASILKSAERCQDLVRQLLGFARKNQEPCKVRRSMNSLVREAATLLAHVHARGIQFQTELAPEAPEALVEPGQIVQVLLNLGINALDALGGAGSLVLRTGQQRVGVQESTRLDCPQGKYGFLEVEDTGAGIPPELLGKIFDPFFTTKPPGQGTGLGLTMAQAIIKEHDGHLQCRSRVGQGTTFRILLPEVQGGEDPGPPSHPGRELKVLLVEDAEPDALLILAALRGGGFTPRFQRVETAEAMTRALAEGTWDLILSDHNMPQFNGFSALTLARKQAPSLPFIFVAGARGDALGEMARRAGAQGCVPKHRLELLGPAVEQALGAGPQAKAPAFAPPGATTILLADDDAAFLSIWARILRQAFKLHVLEARDGSEAVQAYRQHAGTIALLILDCNMPALSGPEALDAIRNLDPTAQAILCSADPEATLEAHVRNHAFQGFIQKPFTVMELGALLKKLTVLP